MGYSLPAAEGQSYSVTVKQEKDQTQARIVEQQELVMEQILLCLPADCYVFGGAVRDYVAQTPFNDIDIFFQSESHREAFIMFLSDRLSNFSGCSLLFVSQDVEHFSEYADRGLSRKIITFTRYGSAGPGINYKLDLIVGKKGKEKNRHPFKLLDADVNSLVRYRNNNVSILPEIADKFKLDLEQVKENIANKVFQPLGCEGQLMRAARREYKLKKQKGYHNLKEGPKMKNKPKKQHSYTLGDKVRVKFLSRESETETVIVGSNIVTNQYLVADPHGWDIQGHRSDGFAKLSSSFTGRCFCLHRDEILGVVEEEKENKAPKKENKNMSQKFVETVKSDSTKASYRIAAKQISKAARRALVALMESKGFKKTWIKSIKEMMETEAGLDAISYALGWAINFVPGLKDDPRVQRLAEEFRVEAMAGVGNQMIDAALEHFAPVLLQLNNLPPIEKARIVADAEPAAASEEEAEEEVIEQSVPARRSRAA